MRILLANNTLSQLAGSETWTCTLALQLKKLGHEVECFSPQLGAISDHLARQEIGCRDRFGKWTRSFSKIFSNWKYDVIIANHHHIVQGLRRWFPWTPILSTVHGIIHRQKHPDGVERPAPEHPAIDSKVGRFVAVSEEVRDVLKRDFDIDAVIVRNFFDLESLKPAGGISERPKRILFNSNYNNPSSPEVEIIREVAAHYAAEFVPVGLNHTKVLDIRQSIDSADIVVGIGRSVLEGVAMGRLGLVHGHWGTGGVVSPQTVETLRQCNFSGRNARGRLMAPAEIVALIDRCYNPDVMGWGMDYVRKEHNVADAANRYVQLALELIANARAR